MKDNEPNPYYSCLCGEQFATSTARDYHCRATWADGDYHELSPHNLVIGGGGCVVTDLYEVEILTAHVGIFPPSASSQVDSMEAELSQIIVTLETIIPATKAAVQQATNDGAMRHWDTEGSHGHLIITDSRSSLDSMLGLRSEYGRCLQTLKRAHVGKLRRANAAQDKLTHGGIPISLQFHHNEHGQNPWGTRYNEWQSHSNKAADYIAGLAAEEIGPASAYDKRLGQQEAANKDTTYLQIRRCAVVKSPRQAALKQATAQTIADILHNDSKSTLWYTLKEYNHRPPIVHGAATGKIRETAPGRLLHAAMRAQLHTPAIRSRPLSRSMGMEEGRLSFALPKTNKCPLCNEEAPDTYIHQRFWCKRTQTARQQFNLGLAGALAANGPRQWFNDPKQDPRVTDVPTQKKQLPEVKPQGELTAMSGAMGLFQCRVDRSKHVIPVCILQAMWRAASKVGEEADKATTRAVRQLREDLADKARYNLTLSLPPGTRRALSTAFAVTHQGPHTLASACVGSGDDTTMRWSDPSESTADRLWTDTITGAPVSPSKDGGPSNILLSIRYTEETQRTFRDITEWACERHQVSQECEGVTIICMTGAPSTLRTKMARDQRCHRFLTIPAHHLESGCGAGWGRQIPVGEITTTALGQLPKDETWPEQDKLCDTQARPNHARVTTKGTVLFPNGDLSPAGDRATQTGEEEAIHCYILSKNEEQRKQALAAAEQHLGNITEALVGESTAKAANTGDPPMWRGTGGSTELTWDTTSPAAMPPDTDKPLRPAAYKADLCHEHNIYPNPSQPAPYLTPDDPAEEVERRRFQRQRRLLDPLHHEPATGKWTCPLDIGPAVRPTTGSGPEHGYLPDGVVLQPIADMYEIQGLPTHQARRAAMAVATAEMELAANFEDTIQSLTYAALRRMGIVPSSTTEPDSNPCAACGASTLVRWTVPWAEEGPKAGIHQEAIERATRSVPRDGMEETKRHLTLRLKRHGCPTCILCVTRLESEQDTETSTPATRRKRQNSILRKCFLQAADPHTADEPMALYGTQPIVGPTHWEGPVDKQGTSALNEMTRAFFQHMESKDQDEGLGDGGNPHGTMPTPTEMDTTGDTEAPPPGPPTPKRAKSTPETSEETILDRTTDGKEEHAQPPASRDKQDQIEEGAACEEGKGHDEIDPTDESLSRSTHLLTPEDVTPPPPPHAEGNPKPLPFAGTWQLALASMTYEPSNHKFHAIVPRSSSQYFTVLTLTLRLHSA